MNLSEMPFKDLIDPWYSVDAHPFTWDQLKAEIGRRLIERDQLKAELVEANHKIYNLETCLEFKNRNVDQLKAELAKVTACLERIANCVDAPDIDATGDWQKGLHCGVEDRDCQDRYDGADYGHAVGVEKGLEWASNEAKTVLATAPEPSTKTP